MDDQGTSRKRGLRFTVRDLFWLSVVVAMAIGWWMHDLLLNKKIAALNSQLTNALFTNQNYEREMQLMTKANDKLRVRVDEIDGTSK